MSVQKIDYENKIGLQNDENVPNKNKVTDDDMNEIKETVNNNADELTTAQQNIEDLQSGQGTASGDITSLKNRVTVLETDNTTNKQDINTLKTDNETNKSNISNLSTNKVDKIEGKGLSTEDYTTAEKQKLAGLNNYDDTEIKADIQEIKTEQITQNKKIEEIEDNQIHITTEKANNINIKDASGQNAKIKLFGISKQEGIPTPENRVEIENVTGDIDITDCNKNLFDEQWTGTTSTNFIPVFAGQKYIYSENGIGQAMNYRFYESKSESYVTKWTAANSTYVPEKNGFVKLDKTNTTKTKCMLEVGEVVTEYIAHEQQTMTFPLQKNQKMMEGSRTENDGIHHKRKQFNLSSLTNVSDWTNKGLNENGTYTYFTRATNLMNYKKYVDLKGFCSHFKFLGTVAGTSFMQSKEEGCAFYYNSTNLEEKLFYINTTIATTEQLVAWLSAQETAETPVMLEYETEEETIEAYTEEQQETHNQLQNAKTYKLVTNIFTENAEVEMEYVAHTKTYIDNEINSVKEELNTIKELLSTTTTSAMLLDNMQTDLESEVL